jgi:hypothetical protein
MIPSRKRGRESGSSFDLMDDGSVLLSAALG